MPYAQKVFSTLLLSDSVSKWVHGQYTGYNLLKQFHAVTYPGASSSMLRWTPIAICLFTVFTARSRIPGHMHIFESQGMSCHMSPKKPKRIFGVLTSAPLALFAHKTANLVGKTKQGFLISWINWQVSTCFLFVSSYFFLSEEPVSFLEN